MACIHVSVLSSWRPWGRLLERQGDAHEGALGPAYGIRQWQVRQVSHASVWKRDCLQLQTFCLCIPCDLRVRSALTCLPQRVGTARP
jgi:hypothetical protein